MQPACIYDIRQSWAVNIHQGPQWKGQVPARTVPPPEQWFDFLGFKVASRLGVPAGPLLDSNWTTLAAQLGYDIVTYKTIRTQASTGHEPPNVLYLATQEQLPAANDGQPLLAVGQELHLSSQDSTQRACTCKAPTAAAAAAAADTLSAAAAAAPQANGVSSSGCSGSSSSGSSSVSPAVAITNSFGMPSMDREFLLADIPAAAAALGPGQLLVVSVTGTPNRSDGVGFEQDFVEAALLAKQAGARVIEANLSCPNVGKGQGALYTDPQQVSAVSAALVSALGPGTPLIIKVGAFADVAQLESVLVAAAAAGVKAVAGINGLSRSIVDTTGAPALGPDRPTSGVCGAPIRQAALDFVRTARDVINRRGLELTLIGVGGVSVAQHVQDMLAAGADVVQSATGMMWNPLLAHHHHALCERAAAGSATEPAAATAKQKPKEEVEVQGGASGVMQGAVTDKQQDQVAVKHAVGAASSDAGALKGADQSAGVEAARLHCTTYL